MLLGALGVPAGRIPDRVEERAALWRAELAPRGALVVLDHAADAEQVRPLLPGARRRCGDVRASADPRAVAEVLRLRGHLPLAIGVAASRLRHRPAWSVSTPAERLHGGRAAARRRTARLRSARGLAVAARPRP
ncbi:hypothetical protein AB0L05_25615 [Nonomuraea pusilla]|uniref:hypothetical protein n=1 Tax=Nonomuraea pusilla TaxID=46177 RepID=UPI003319C488